MPVKSTRTDRPTTDGGLFSDSIILYCFNLSCMMDIIHLVIRASANKVGRFDIFSQFRPSPYGHTKRFIQFSETTTFFTHIQNSELNHFSSGASQHP